MTATLDPHQTVLAEMKRGRETVTAEHHPDDYGGMKYSVHILGGKHHGMVFHCSTNKSAIAIFDRIVYAYQMGLEWKWMK